MLKWTLRSASESPTASSTASCSSLQADAHYAPSSGKKVNLKDSNKCYGSKKQVKLAQVKTTLKFKENHIKEYDEATENGDSVDSSSNHSKGRSSADSREGRNRKRQNKSVKCSTLDPLRLFSNSDGADSDSGSVYMRLQHTPMALLKPVISNWGHQDPRRRPLIDLSNGDYSALEKHLQTVYLSHPHSNRGNPQSNSQCSGGSTGGDLNSLPVEVEVTSREDVMTSHDEKNLNENDVESSECSVKKRDSTNVTPAKSSLVPKKLLFDSPTPSVKGKHKKFSSLDGGNFSRNTEISKHFNSGSGLFRRGKVEGSSYTKLQAMTEAFKRHSIASIPKDLFDSKLRRRRDSSTGRVKKSRVIVDIDLNDREKIESDEGVVEPLYERVKSLDEGINSTSYFDNALYMTMKDEEIIYSQPTSLIALSPKSIRSPIYANENPYENVLYLPMTDANKNARPLPSIPVVSKSASTQTDKCSVTPMKNNRVTPSSKKKTNMAIKENGRPKLPIPAVRPLNYINETADLNRLQLHENYFNNPPTHPTNVSLSDNPDSGVSEGMITPNMSPCSPNRSPVFRHNVIPLEQTVENGEPFYSNIPHDVTDPRFFSLFLNESKHSNFNVSKMLHSAVGRNLFNGTAFEIKEDLSRCRRHSISSIDDLSKSLSKFSHENSVSFWNNLIDSSVSLEMGHARRSRSMEDISNPYNDVPLLNSVEGILQYNTSSSTYKRFIQKEDAQIQQRQRFPQHEQLELSQKDPPTFTKERSIGHQIRARRGGGHSIPGNKSFLSPQRCRLSSSEALTSEYPEMMKQVPRIPPSGRSDFTSVLDRESVSEVVPCVNAISTHPRPEEHVEAIGYDSSGSIPLKLLNRNIQKQEESSYRLLRLFQDCNLGSIEESEDEEELKNWLSADWSREGTLDENSSRDPRILDLSTTSSSADNNSLESSGDEIILTPHLFKKLSQVSENDKMLAKFRKSLRRKDKIVQPPSNVFLFVDNPMYLSPEMKKEAKVIPSLNNNNWYFNSQISNQQINKTNARTFVRNKNSVSVECEKENMKNIRLAECDEGVNLQSNPCYDTTIQSKDTHYLEPLAEDSNKAGKDVTDIDKYLEHQYSTIDEETDSWITQSQSSGSLHPNSPASKRNMEFQDFDVQFSGPDLPRKKSHSVSSKQVLRSNRVRLGSEPTGGLVRCGSVPAHRLQRSSVAVCTDQHRLLDVTSRTNSFREQFVTESTPPTVPPPLPFKLREQLLSRPNASLSTRTASHVQYVNGYPQGAECALPPDGVYETVSTVNFVLNKPPNIPSTKENTKIPPTSVTNFQTKERANMTSNSSVPKENSKRNLTKDSAYSKPNKTPKKETNGTDVCDGEAKAQQQLAASSEKPKALAPPKTPSRVIPKTPSRRCCKVGLSSIGTPKNSSSSLVRTRRVPPTRRSQTSASTTTSKYRARDVLEGKGLLNIAAYENCGLFTIHIIEARRLKSRSSNDCNPYVKISLTPDSDERTFCRTPLHHSTTSPLFNQQFSFDFLPGDYSKRLLVSVWNRDINKRRSEFLGCMSFSVGHILKKRVHGWFRLLTEAVGRRKHFAAPAVIPLSVTDGTEGVCVDPIQGEHDNTGDCSKHTDESYSNVQKASGRLSLLPTSDCSSANEEVWTSQITNSYNMSHTNRVTPTGTNPNTGNNPYTGQTPYTLTINFNRSSRGYGFAVTWTRPPRVERVEPGLPASNAGLLPGDYLIFVGAVNVVKLGEKEVLNIIRQSGDNLSLEVYRKGITPTPGPTQPTSRLGTLNHSQPSTKQTYSNQLTLHQLPQFRAGVHNHTYGNQSAVSPFYQNLKKVNQVSYVSSTSTRVHLQSNTNPQSPMRAQVASDVTVHCQHLLSARVKLLSTERHLLTQLRRCVDAYALPLAFRTDLLTETEHQILFVSVGELLKTTEEVVRRMGEQIPPLDDFGTLTQPRPVGSAYHPLLHRQMSLYRQLLSTRLVAHQIVAGRLATDSFRRFLANCQVASTSLIDLVGFVSLPGQHYREVVGLLQELTVASMYRPEEDPLLDTVHTAYRSLYHEVTTHQNIMEPSYWQVPGSNCSQSPGRVFVRQPFISVSDIAARLVFTRFAKPFTLDTKCRHWLFGGELSKSEGRDDSPYWVLLFSDLLLFTIINRDRVIFVVDEPIPLRAIQHVEFDIKRKPLEFRLIVDSSISLHRSTSISSTSLHTPNKTPWSRFRSSRCHRRSLELTAPTEEHKAAWSNLIQKQIQWCQMCPSPLSPNSPPFPPLEGGSVARASSEDTLHRVESPSSKQQELKSSCESLPSTPQYLETNIDEDPAVERRVRLSPKSALESINTPATLDCTRVRMSSVDSRESDVEKYRLRPTAKPETKLKGISSRFKAKLFPNRILPKKKENPLKKVEKYVNSLSVEQVENRSVTPVFEEEDGLLPQDYVRKRNEILKQNKNKDYLQGENEIIVLDLQSQDDHLEAAMERRQTLLKMREEKKNSLKLEGILEESPQVSPHHGVSLITPEDYENYLDSNVVHDYPELAATPASMFSPENETPMEQTDNLSPDVVGFPSPKTLRNYYTRTYSQDHLKVAETTFEFDVSQDDGAFVEDDTDKDMEKSEIMLCNTRIRSFSDSDELSNLNHKCLRNINSYDSSNYTSSTCTSGESTTRRSISYTSGYSSVSFDSSCGSSTKKKSTLFLPSTATISLPEISLQPPTPQSSKPKNNEKVKYDLVVPGYRSMFLTVPGANENHGRSLPGPEPPEYSSSESSSEDEDVIHKPRALSGLNQFGSKGLRKFGSTCNISSLGLNFSMSVEDSETLNESKIDNVIALCDQDPGNQNMNELNNNEKNLERHCDSNKIETPFSNLRNTSRSNNFIASKVALFERSNVQTNNNVTVPPFSTNSKCQSSFTKHASSPKTKRKPLRINPEIFLWDSAKSKIPNPSQNSETLYRQESLDGHFEEFNVDVPRIRLGSSTDSGAGEVYDESDVEGSLQYPEEKDLTFRRNIGTVSSMNFDRINSVERDSGPPFGYTDDNSGEVFEDITYKVRMGKY